MTGEKKLNQSDNHPFIWRHWNYHRGNVKINKIACPVSIVTIRLRGNGTVLRFEFSRDRLPGKTAKLCLILYPKCFILYSECMPYWFDGNNLIGQSAAAAKADRQTRRAFLSTLSLYHKSGGGKFLVYFDGDDPGRSSAPTGVAVRYSAPESADAAILRRLQEIQHPSEFIIVTNDRELMARCRHAGAAALDWRQFTSKMQSRPTLQSHKTKDLQDRVDVDDWIRYFGLDNTNK
jgi:hypothetical protein